MGLPLITSGLPLGSILDVPTIQAFQKHNNVAFVYSMMIMPIQWPCTVEVLDVKFTLHTTL